MIPKAITAPFRWWAKHPWDVFWGTILFFFVINFAALALSRSSVSVFVARTIWLLSPIVLIFSFCRGVFVTWQRSKIGAVLIAVGVPLILVGILAAIAIPQFAAYDRAAYKSEIRSNLRVAPNAQRSYFAKNSSYKSCPPCTSRDLPGFHNSSEVTLNAEVGRTDFRLVATHEKCGDEWTYQSTTGEITGPDAIDSCK